ncbi:hypothetical protein, partial [Thiolapillus sp.]|uniref:hypothetical protein n=1 Tax=Thiolapillus sp. TaxID=2017437 RepID=UPI003AF685BA
DTLVWRRGVTETERDGIGGDILNINNRRNTMALTAIIALNKDAAILAGKSDFGPVRLSVDPSVLTTEERQEIVRCTLPSNGTLNTVYMHLLFTTPRKKPSKPKTKNWNRK